MTTFPTKATFTVWLVAYPYLQPFWCLSCGTLMFKYRGSPLSIIPGDLSATQETNTIPIEIKCPNNHCNQKVLLAGLVNQV